MDITGKELVGTRTRSAQRVGCLEPEHLVEMWGRVTSRIIKHGFALEYRDLEPPRTGTFNGLRIVIDPDVSFEMQCFIVLHLFGHSVQWVATSLEHKLAGIQNSTDKEAFLKALHDYEFEAAQFGLHLLHEVGVTHLDQWFSDFVATDWRYVERYYREGRIPEWQDCVTTSRAVVQPIPVPQLKHREVQVRFAF